MSYKRVIAAALALCMLLALTACGETAPAQSGSTAEVQTLAAGDLTATTELHGIVDQYTGDTVTVEDLSEGNATVFPLAGAELRCDNGIHEGDFVTVFYTGEIGTATLAVTLVIDNAAKAAPSIGTMNGTIVDATMNNLIVRATDGSEYDFDKSGAQVYAVNGLLIGNPVVVTYTVKDGVNVAVSITDNAANTVEFNPLPEGTTFVAGTETLMAANNLNVRKGADTSYDRMGGITAGSKVYVTGTCSNGWARINYNGKEGYVAEEYLVPVPAPAQPAQSQAAQPAASSTPAASAPAPVQPAQPKNSDIGHGATMNTTPEQTAPATDGGIGQGVTADTTPEQTAPATDGGIGQGVTADTTPEQTAPATDGGIGQGVTADTTPEQTAPAADGGIGQGVTEEPVSNETTGPEPDFLILTGTVTDITGNTLVMAGDDDNSHTLDVTNATRQYVNGIQAGNAITIHYTGTLGGDMTVLSVIDNEPNTPIAGMVTNS